MRNGGGRHWKRGAGGFISALYFLTQGMGAYAVESSFWGERRRATRPVVSRIFPDENFPSPAPSLDPVFAKKIARDARLAPLIQSLLPFGRVRDVQLSPATNAPLILHIEDIHDHFDAQQNMAEMVLALSKSSDIQLVGLEGATGALANEEFRGYPNPSAVKMAGMQFLKKNLVGGPEFASLISEKPITLWGIEDPALYRANVTAVRDALQLSQQADSILKSLTKVMGNLKADYYSKDLLDLESRQALFERGEQNCGDYLQYLALVFSREKIEMERRFPQTHRFLTAQRNEQTMDFAEVEKQRATVLQILTSRWEPKEARDFIQSGIEFREGRLTHAQFHNQLIDLGRKHGVEMEKYAALLDYQRNLSAWDAINHDGLLREIADLGADALKVLAKTPEQKILVDLSRDAALVKKLLRLEMTPQDWAAYFSRKGESRFGDQLNRLLGGRSGTFPSMDKFSAIKESFETFYARAMDRNAALGHRLLNKMEQGNHKTAVLVAGGFHTEGLMEVLNQRGASIVVLTPRIKEINFNQRPIDAFTHDPPPLEKIFSGPPNVLKSPCGLSDRNVIDQLHLAILALICMTLKNDGASESQAQIALNNISKTVKSLSHRFSDLRVKFSGKAIKIIYKKIEQTAKSFWVDKEENGEITVTVQRSEKKSLQDAIVAFVMPLLETGLTSLLMNNISVSGLLVAPFAAGGVTLLLTPVLVGFISATVHALVWRARGRDVSASSFRDWWIMGTGYALPFSLAPLFEWSHLQALLLSAIPHLIINPAVVYGFTKKLGNSLHWAWLAQLAPGSILPPREKIDIQELRGALPHIIKDEWSRGVPYQLEFNGINIRVVLYADQTDLIRKVQVLHKHLNIPGTEQLIDSSVDRSGYEGKPYLVTNLVGEKLRGIGATMGLMTDPAITQRLDDFDSNHVVGLFNTVSDLRSENLEIQPAMDGYSVFYDKTVGFTVSGIGEMAGAPSEGSEKDDIESTARILRDGSSIKGTEPLMKKARAKVIDSLVSVERDTAKTLRQKALRQTGPNNMEIQLVGEIYAHIAATYRWEGNAAFEKDYFKLIWEALQWVLHDDNFRVVDISKAKLATAIAIAVSAAKRYQGDSMEGVLSYMRTATTLDDILAINSDFSGTIKKWAGFSNQLNEDFTASDDLRKLIPTLQTKHRIFNAALYKTSVSESGQIQKSEIPQKDQRESAGLEPVINFQSIPFPEQGKGIPALKVASVKKEQASHATFVMGRDRGGDLEKKWWNVRRSYSIDNATPLESDIEDYRQWLKSLLDQKWEDINADFNSNNPDHVAAWAVAEAWLASNQNQITSKFSLKYIKLVRLEKKRFGSEKDFDSQKGRLAIAARYTAALRMRGKSVTPQTDNNYLAAQGNDLDLLFGACTAGSSPNNRTALISLISKTYNETLERVGRLSLWKELAWTKIPIYMTGQTQFGNDLEKPHLIVFDIDLLRDDDTRDKGERDAVETALAGILSLPKEKLDRKEVILFSSRSFANNAAKSAFLEKLHAKLKSRFGKRIGDLTDFSIASPSTVMGNDGVIIENEGKSGQIHIPNLLKSSLNINTENTEISVWTHDPAHIAGVYNKDIVNILRISQIIGEFFKKIRFIDISA